MKERPILFNAAMVRAILIGQKTQTRRICKPAANLSAVVACQDPTTFRQGQMAPCLTPGWFGDEEGDVQFFCPYGQPCDRLWVRESFDFLPDGGPDQPDSCMISYWADVSMESRNAPTDYNPVIYGREKVRPSIHMPRWASRITLEIVSVRVERLNDISQEDAIAEGAPPSHPSIDNISRGFGYSDFSRSWFAQLWESINGPGSWAANPWVWVIEFKRVQEAIK